MHDIARAAAEAADTPSFDDVVARGRRLRGRRQALAVTGSALAVAAVIGATQLLGMGGGHHKIEPGPAHQPSVSGSVHATGPADRVVDAPGAWIADATLIGDGGAAVVWRERPHEDWAVAVSGDDFATRAALPLPYAGDVVAAGERVIVRDEAHLRLWVVDPSGVRRPVGLAGGVGPVASGEVAVTQSRWGLVAVDPVSATAHRVPEPAGGVVDVDAYGGRLSFVSEHVTGGATDTVTYHWSDDGGATWASAAFDKVWNSTVQIVPTGSGADHVLAISTSNKAIKPLGSVLTLPAGGGAFTETQYAGPVATFSGAWVVDGQLRLLGDIWGRSTRPEESGVFRWVGGRLEHVSSSAPQATDAEQSALVDVDDTDGGPSLLIAVGVSLYRSTDGGTTWDEIAAR